MSRRSMLIIGALIAAVVALAAILDLAVPRGERGVARFVTIFDLSPGSRSAPVPGRGFDPPFLRGDWPRAARSLAAIAALAGYGLLLRYLAPGRLGTLARATAGTPARLLQQLGNGALLLLLAIALTLLSALSVVAGPLAPLLFFGLGFAILTGLVAFAISVGQRLRAWAGATEHSPLADLLAGLPVFILLALIPYIGTLALALAGLVGLGAVATTRCGATERWKVEAIDY